MFYKLLLIDLDDTLLDFHADARKALRKTCEALSLPLFEGLYEQYEYYNEKLWSQLERGEIGIEDIKTDRFKDFVTEMRIGVDPVALNKMYEKHLSQEATLFEGVHETLDYLRNKYTLLVASNGIARVQEGRMAAASLNEYFRHSILSEEIGVSKPDPGFFHLGLEKFSHIPKEKMLMIGDSLSSDIKGALSFGIDTCWVNRQKKERPQDLSITREVSSFPEVRCFL